MEQLEGAERDPQHERASAASVATLYETTAAWLSENVPLYTSLQDQAVGGARTYNGLPITENDLLEHQIEIPGRLIREYEPVAAAALGIEDKDTFVANYIPTMYMQDEPEPTLITPFCTVGIKKGDIKKTDTHCHVNNPIEGVSHLNWEGPDYDFLTEGSCQAFAVITSRLGDLHAELVRIGEYPEDHVVARREEEIATRALEGLRTMEAVAKRAARERLDQAPTMGAVGPKTLHRLRYSDFIGEPTRTYTLVNRQDIDSLWATTTGRLLECNVPMHAFSDQLAAKIGRAFHNPETAAKTVVVSASLKAESSEDGVAVVFTFGKEVLLNNGIKRYETDSFVVLKKAYIRLLTTRHSFTGQPRTAQINIETPMTRPQYDVCLGLVNWVDPA